MDKELDLILKNLFYKVNAKFEPKKVMVDDWFLKYWWTSKEEEEYRSWLYKLLVQNRKLRDFFLKTTSVRSRKTYKNAVEQFTNNFGWVTLRLVKELDIEGYYLEDVEHCLSKKDYKDFLEFMKGQTVASLSSGTLVYEWDFGRWLSTHKDRRRK